jgi:hypothetical protein
MTDHDLISIIAAAINPAAFDSERYQSRNWTKDDINSMRNVAFNTAGRVYNALRGTGMLISAESRTMEPTEGSND